MSEETPAPQGTESRDFVAEARAALETQEAPSPPPEPENPQETPVSETPEEKPEGEGSAPPPDDLPSTKLKRLMDREAKTVEREQFLRQREAELAAQAAQIAANQEKIAKYEAAERRWREEQAAKAPQQQTPQDPELVNLKQRFEQLQAAYMQTQEVSARANVRNMVSAAQEDFQLVNAANLHDQVYELVVKNWNDEPPEVDLQARVKKAAQFVEEALERETLEPLLKTAKARRKMGIAEGSTQQSPREQTGAKQTTTVSNSLSAAPPVPKAPAGKILTEDEYLARARAALSEIPG